jgi:hypothetical protein
MFVLSYFNNNNHDMKKCNICNKSWDNNLKIHCEKCHIIHKKEKKHCCECLSKWNIYNQTQIQIHCQKCNSLGFIGFSFDGINITNIMTKYNGEAIIYDLYGKIIYNGNLKNGKYYGYGNLYVDNIEKNFKYIYKGDFDNNQQSGFGVLYYDKYKEKVFSFTSKQEESCNLCMEEYSEDELFPICGGNNCIECCIKCIKSFLKKIRCGRGSILTYNCLLCPFCRKNINEYVISVYKPGLVKYLDSVKKLKNQKQIVGLCSECDKHEIHELNVECGEQNNKEKYICVECMNRKAFDNVKQCPNCSIKTTKTEGCHFIKCMCKKAWCWHCFKIMPYNEIHAWNCKYCGKGT